MTKLAKVPRLVAKSLAREAATLDLLVRGGVLSAQAARVQITRLAAKLGGLR